ncbi:MAG: thiamine phosphate synthase [Campylobacterales bacterium]
MGLYGLLDWELLEKYQLGLGEFLRGAKGLKIKILQYRDKRAPLEVKLERIREIRSLWDGLLIVNDQPELLNWADGIHLGQEDLQALSHRSGLPPGEIIQLLREGNPIPSYPLFPAPRKNPNRGWKLRWELGVGGRFKKIVGLSTHNRVEVIFANTYPLSYIGVGAYRYTSTKGRAKLLNREELSEILKLSHHPVGVIGGVRLSDKISAKFKVVGSDLCRYISTQLRKSRSLKQK